MRLRPLSRVVVRIGAALLAVGIAGFCIWLLRLPSAAERGAPPTVPRAESNAMIEALRPPKRERPLIAIIGINDATETTDYLMPAGILRRADVADVTLLATGPGPVKLYPALTVEADATIAQFDERNPAGADYVVVPAMSRDDDPAVLSWLQAQSKKGATIIGVCVGAKVVGAAGLLDGKRATTHWFVRKELLERSPSIVYVRDRRIVIDRGVATTTGITASMPMMLTLIEAIAGRARAEEVARDLGLPEWDARHASDAFRLTRPFATTVLANLAAVWNRERVGIEIQPGVDEVSLALVADAWSRTYRSKARTCARVQRLATQNGVRIIPDELSSDFDADHRVTISRDQKPADALDHTLRAIGARYGRRTADVVAMQLEYPGRDRQAAPRQARENP